MNLIIFYQQQSKYRCLLTVRQNNSAVTRLCSPKPGRFNDSLRTELDLADCICLTSQ